MRSRIAVTLILLAGCSDDINVGGLDLAVPSDLAPVCVPDAGGPDGGGWDRCTNRCYRPTGYWCQLGTGMDRCLSDDGCNACDCYLNQGFWSCTEVACNVPDLGARPDGAPSWPFCRNDGDCFPGKSCHFDPDPTEPLGRCTR